MSDRALLEQLAKKENLELFGIVELIPEPQFVFYTEWIAKEFHGNMSYLAKNLEFRKNPNLLLPGSKSAIILGYSYYVGEQAKDSAPKIAQYAMFPDYHKVLRKKGTSLVENLQKSIGTHEAFRVAVDSAPVLERALAARSQTGFIGKNTCFIHPQKGSFFNLLVILSTLTFSYDAQNFVDPTQRSPEKGGCGSCNRCRIHCPTGALDTPYQLDARKCLAYYSIEHRGPIPLEFWPHFKLYFFGCDICQLVCPYNRKIAKTVAEEILKIPSLSLIACMNQAEYESFFGGTALTRAKKTGLQRNALIAMTVRKDPKLQQVIDALEKEEDPMIQATLSQIKEFNRER